jgi:predicted RNA-binding Zn-ribbon protein involved in translation (DUF1610 family)
MTKKEAITTINKVTLYDGIQYKISLDKEIKEQLFEEFLSNMSQIPVFEHKCNSCGGIIEMDANNHIFVCPYCGTTYAIGTMMINDKGDKKWI